MQLISFTTLAFVFAAAVVSAMPVPVNPGDVHMAKNVPLHTRGGAHPVVAVSGHDSAGHVHVVQRSHNLRGDVNKFSKRAKLTNGYVGPKKDQKHNNKGVGPIGKIGKSLGKLVRKFLPSKKLSPSRPRGLED